MSIKNVKYLINLDACVVALKASIDSGLLVPGT